LRQWMDRDGYQGVTPVLNVTAANSTSYWMSHPELAWTFLVIADPDFWMPHFTGIRIHREPEADFEVGGRPFAIFAHDWRVEPIDEWQVNVYVDDEASPAEPVSTRAPLLVLSEREFAEAVRQALRDYARPDQLAQNPLLRSKLVADASETAAPVNALQSLLGQAVDALDGNPKDAKFYRALWHTYIKPAPTQERAAERLNLPFNTYRYHLTNGLKRVVAWLWQREVG
jgi:hypothetical protein